MMTGSLVLCFVSLLLGTCFAEIITPSLCDQPCSNRPCTPPRYGTCCQKENIAWGSNQTDQSSNYRDRNGRIFYSNLAVDGNTNTNFLNNTCTHTNDKRDAYWMIKLQNKVNISDINLYLRVDNVIRYNGLRVDVNSNECFRLNKTFSEPSFKTPLEYKIQQLHCSPPIPGSLVKISVNTGMLTLCEVQIFSCRPGWYSKECDRQCNCRNSTDCDKTNGWCRDGCRAGKQGEGCQCDCPDGKYGLDCRESCGHCLDGTVCDKTNGTCHNGCEQGYQLPLCRECDNNFHKSGESCEACGLCEDNTTCNSTSGKCPGNCQAGYKQPFCKEKCKDGRFGINCSSTCGKCSGNQTCNKTDGTCPKGCVDHFVPPMCTECKDGCFGINCSSTCGRCSGNQTCNKTNGTCPKGCVEHFVPPMCTECEDGRFGINCSTCGRCSGNQTCNKTDGTCPKGCVDHFVPPMCTEIFAATSQPTVDEEVRSNMAPMAGGVSAAIVLIIIIIVVVIIIWKRRRFTNQPKTTVVSKDENQRDTSFINISATRPSQMIKKSPTKTSANQAPETSSEERSEVRKTEPSGGGNEYYSVIPAPITLPKLPQYMKDRINGVGFDNEFKLLPYGILEDHNEGKKPENKKRNRFLELYPYDHSRVVLEPEDGADWDYINANYIGGYRGTKTFIAAQGPNPVTVDDFWRMIWQQNVTKIVMVTRLKELQKKKCEQYWPDDKEMRAFGKIRVHHEYSTVRRDYTIRTFKIKHASHASESREITQLQFTSWPDHDVPSAPALVSFWKQFRRLQHEQETEPVVVHCSAGVGRTGTFIALDCLFDEAEREEKVNVFNCVNRMRKARMNMVQTASQYTFLHEVVLEAVQSRNTFYTSTEFHLKFGTDDSFTDDQEREIRRQFEILKTMQKLFTDKQVSDAKSPENISKNRDPNVLPENKSKPYLMTPVKGRTQYINAVVLPSHVRPSAMIATQTPLQDTVVDFWRLVYDHDIINVVCLEAFELLYPSKDAPVDSGPFQICLEKERIKRNCFTEAQISLTYMEEHEESRQITVYRPSCARPSDLVGFVNEMETRDVFRQGQLLVHCSNGSDLCGLFCGVLNIITRLRLDQEVDIFLDIRELQSIRPSFIHSLDQYRFCFDAVKEYERSTSIYANL